jgi:hypothetical protein
VGSRSIWRKCCRNGGTDDLGFRIGQTAQRFWTVGRRFVKELDANVGGRIVAPWGNLAAYSPFVALQLMARYIGHKLIVHHIGNDRFFASFKIIVNKCFQLELSRSSFIISILTISTIHLFPGSQSLMYERHQKTPVSTWKLWVSCFHSNLEWIRSLMLFAHEGSMVGWLDHKLRGHS